MEDLELKAMNEELQVFYKLEQKEEIKKRLEQMRKKHGGKLPPVLKSRVNQLKATAEKHGFKVVDARRIKC